MPRPPARPARARPLPAAAQVRITRVGADGDGVATLPDGSAIYLPFTLPDEEVLAQPLAPHGQGWAGRAESLLEPSPQRVVPPCPHAGSCGGCSLQHWQEAPYRAWKTGLLTAALRHAGFTIEPAPLVCTEPGARRRVDLALRRQGPAARVGLHPARAGEVIDLTACPVLAPELFALIAPLRALLGGRDLLRRTGSAILNLLDNGTDLLLRSDAAPSPADRKALIAFAQAHDLSRISWASETGDPETVCAFRPPELRLSGIAVRPPPGAFLQASASGEAAIVAAVLAGLPAKLTARARVIELFAGCGTLSFALAQRARVAAFEGEPAAAAALRAAVNAHVLAGRITVERRDLTRRPLIAAEMAGAAAVVLDPPHVGAAGQMAAIVAAHPGRVIYVSCNPAALARDAAVLQAAGYTLLSATPIDQFLWSARLESVAVFARG